MSAVRWLVVCFVALLLLTGGLLAAQDAKKEGPTKFRGQLPQNWSKLGLTDVQKQQTYKVQTEYDDKVEALNAQIRDLRAKEKAELDKILTADQKKRLREILNEKVPGAADEKKPN